MGYPTDETQRKPGGESLGQGGVHRFAALCVSADSRVVFRLRESFGRMGWKLYEARSCREASKVLGSYRMPIILCDSSLPDGQWRDILSLVAPLLEPPRVIVLADAARDTSRSEVLGMGGDGVLSRTWSEDEIAALPAVYRRPEKALAATTAAAEAA